jgi:DNA polymerase-4
MVSASGTSPVGFAEVPDFHVAIARRADPSLLDRPVLVGGDPRKQGRVVAASEALRSIGIQEGWRVAEALDRAPEALWVPTDMTRAREASGALRAAVREIIDAIEVDGLAGFFMRAPRDPEEARAWAMELAANVLARTGLPLRTGVAPARFAAQLAAREAGEAGVCVVSSEDFETFLLRQPLERLPGVGPKTSARLAELGVVDVPGLRALGLERLEVLLGNHGRTLWLLASGEDPKPLRVRRHPETLSRAETLAEAVDLVDALEAPLQRLCGGLERALRREGLRAARLALRLTAPDDRVLTRSFAFERPVAAAEMLFAAARSLVLRVDLASHPARRIALVLKGLEAGEATDRQLDLF